MLKSKFLKILLIITLLFSICMPLVCAINETTNSNVQTTENENATINTNMETEHNISTTVSTISSVEDNSLDFSNILDILLIAIGIVIILLAIAILLRLNKSF